MVPRLSAKVVFKNNDFAIRELLLDEFRWYGRGMYPAMGTEYFE